MFNTLILAILPAPLTTSMSFNKIFVYLSVCGCVGEELYTYKTVCGCVGEELYTYKTYMQNATQGRSSIHTRHTCRMLHRGGALYIQDIRAECYTTHTKCVIFTHHSLCIFDRPTYTLTSFFGGSFFSTSDFNLLKRNGLRTPCSLSTSLESSSLD